jgi:anti-sigma factor RsiW
MIALGDEDLNAYIDGRLDAEQAFSVAAHLARHPREAARAASLRAATDALRLVLDPVLQQPVPERLRALLRRHGIRAARWRKAFTVASVTLTLALAGLGGRALQEHLSLFATVSSAPAPPAASTSDPGRLIRI